MTGGSGSLPARRKPQAVSANTPSRDSSSSRRPRDYTTTFTSLPGTMITLRTGSTPMNFCTFGSAKRRGANGPLFRVHGN